MKTIKKFKYKYIAKITSVYDGDGAYDSVIDMGMKLYIERKVRLYGIDTPELKGKEKDAGKKVRNFVRELILNKNVVLYTKKDKSGKYGRLLASIKLENGTDLAELLIAKKYAKLYLGGKKKKWTQSELHTIITSE